MASSVSLHEHYSIYCLHSTHTLRFAKYPHHHISTTLPSSRRNFLKLGFRTTVPFAVTPKSIEPDPQSLVQQLADSFSLPSDYFSQLPSDLRLDLNDAAFDLSNGSVKDECGDEVGEILLNISRAWEAADTSTSTSLMEQLPLLVSSLTGSQKTAFGKRLLSSGKRFRSMGQYGGGEVAKIAEIMISTGKLLSESSESGVDGEEVKQQVKTFKFGDLQVELTSAKAYTGAAIALVFSFLSWELSQGVQNIQESSLNYANENALLIAKSLRGSLLVMSYSSTILSAFSVVGLILLGGQLKSEGK